MTFRSLLTLVILTFAWLHVGSTDARTQAAEPFPYLSPRPDAQMVSAGTTIAIRNGVQLSELPENLFRVQGSDSGLHSGNTILADDEKTVIFVPDQPFAAAETVSVTVAPGISTATGQRLDGASFQFTVSAGAGQFDTRALGREPANVPAAEAGTIPTPPPTEEPDTSSYLTAPDSFPHITVTVPVTDTHPDYTFVSPYYGPDALCQKSATPRYYPYLLILDDVGEPVFYKQLELCRPAFDFKKQPNGLLTYFNSATNRFEALDGWYRLVDTYQAGNGYNVDLHDLQILPNGHILLMADDPQLINLSEIVPGASPAAVVVGTVVQELDASRNVIFQWRSWDHISVTDTNQALIGTPYIRYTHGNAVEMDTDGNILLSSRHLDEITKIDRETGDIIWRWGGKQNEFEFIGGVEPFRYQHDVRRLSNGNISLFDNRTLQFPQYSRAVEYILDEDDRTATLAWEYRNSPDTYSFAAGNAQRLPSGNTVVGWGNGRPALTETTPAGEKAFQLTFADSGFISYRSFRFPWAGIPIWPPSLVMQPTAEGVQLAFSWNGATDVVGYEVYAGLSPHTPIFVTEVEKTGFETRLEITDIPAEYCYFRVLPITEGARATFFSNPVRLENPACHSVYFPLLRNF